jgi:2,3-dihydroxybenzoate decarboxylase
VSGVAGAGNKKGKKMTSKIALEEHFMTPGFEGYSKPFTSLMSDIQLKELGRKLSDFDGARIEAMNRFDIELMILSQTGPGIQAEESKENAVRLAQQSNDFLANRVKESDGRFAGFGTLPLQAPDAAVKELERCVRELGFKGVLVNGHTLGSYLDEDQYSGVWEALSDLDVPLYLHPIDAIGGSLAFSGHPELAGAVWGWGVETGTHALRLIFSGVFDRFPKARIVLGHMGEGLPFLRWRFDSRFSVYSHGISLSRRPSEYFGSNILITTSGVCSEPTLLAAIGEMGEDSVMFSVDYPYEDVSSAVDFIDGCALPDSVKKKVCSGNARRIFKL